MKTALLSARSDRAGPGFRRGTLLPFMRFNFIILTFSTLINNKLDRSLILKLSDCPDLEYKKQCEFALLT